MDVYLNEKEPPLKTQLLNIIKDYQIAAQLGPSAIFLNKISFIMID